jgi:hypothetical protein
VKDNHVWLALRVQLAHARWKDVLQGANLTVGPGKQTQRHVARGDGIPTCLRHYQQLRQFAAEAEQAAGQVLVHVVDIRGAQYLGEREYVAKPVEYLVVGTARIFASPFLA